VQYPEAKLSLHVLAFAKHALYQHIRWHVWLFAEKALVFMSSCYSNRSSGDRWGFGNEVVQLSFGGTQGALGMESYEWLLRISDQPGSLWQQCYQDEKLSLQSI